MICCSDSRAAPEHITRADPGTLFVKRTVAGLVPTPPGTLERRWLRLYGSLTRWLGLRDLSGAAYGPWAAIEFPLVQLEVPNIIVLGHSGCGGGGARHAASPRPADLPDTDAWVDMVRPTVRRAIAIDGQDQCGGAPCRRTCRRPLVAAQPASPRRDRAPRPPGQVERLCRSLRHRLRAGDLLERGDLALRAGGHRCRGRRRRRAGARMLFTSLLAPEKKTCCSAP